MDINNIPIGHYGVTTERAAVSLGAALKFPKNPEMEIVGAEEEEVFRQIQKQLSIINLSNMDTAK